MLDERSSLSGLPRGAHGCSCSGPCFGTLLAISFGWQVILVASLINSLLFLFSFMFRFPFYLLLLSSYDHSIFTSMFMLCLWPPLFLSKLCQVQVCTAPQQNRALFSQIRMLNFCPTIYKCSEPAWSTCSDKCQ